MLSNIKRILSEYSALRRVKKETKSYPKVTVVDDKDKFVAYLSLYDALISPYRRRVSLVFLFRARNEILLQLRSPYVLSPNCWDISAAGHVNEGDTYVQTAKQELAEELGLIVELTEVATGLLTPGHVNGIYKAVLPIGTDLHLNKHEVKQVRWITINEMESEMKEFPENFSSSFLQVWSRYRDKILAA